MDGSRFDDFARTFVTSRRGALKTLLSGAAAGIAAILARDGSAAAAAVTGAAAQDDERRDPFYRAGLACDAGQRCGRLAPCEFGLCTPKACLIDGKRRKNLDSNPANTCQFCAPTLESWTEWLGIVSDGEPCESDDEDPCLTPSGICLGGECVRNPLSDNECGPDKVCCDGDCCERLEICVDFNCTPGCVIDDEKYRTGFGNPASPLCQLCDPDSDRTAWTILPDGPNVSCDECCQGFCCGFGLVCIAGGCVPGCRIPLEPGSSDFGRYVDGEQNPDNHCQICSLSVSNSVWTPDDSQRCGANSDLYCCNGECCPPGECCDQGLACSAAACGCEIGGIPYPADEPHPDPDVCKACKPASRTDDWTNLSNKDACGGGGTRVCCNGLCCPQDQCCNSETGFCGRCSCDGEQGRAGVRASLLASCSVCCDGLCCGPDECCSEEGGCVPCASGCEIDGQFHPAGTFKDGDPCRVCDPARDRNAWSVATDGAACGCEIGGIGYAEGDVKPDNPCQVCDPTAAPDDWTPVLDGSACVPNGDQVCCAGACCPLGDCCTEAGVCEPCGCLIEGQGFAEGEVNSDNECEVCNPAISTTDWSPPSEPTICAGGEGLCCGRECCNAVCCPGDLCCAGSAVCGECGGDECTIEGATFPEGAIKANGCEMCNPFFSTISWTVRRDDELCGPDGTQFCCNGVCCGPLACCNADDVCEIGGGSICEESCEIDGQLLPHSFINPANPCQECDTFDSLTNWSPRLNIFPCGADLQQTCCNGTCCDCCSSSYSGGACMPCP